MNNEAVSEIVGSILLIVISVCLFSLVYLNVFSLGIPMNERPLVSLSAEYQDGNVTINHEGGETVDFTVFQNGTTIKSVEEFEIGDKLTFKSIQGMVNVVSDGYLLLNFEPIDYVIPPQTPTNETEELNIYDVILFADYEFCNINFKTDIPANASLFVIVEQNNNSFILNHEFNVTNLSENTYYDYFITCYSENGTVAYYNDSFLSLDYVEPFIIQEAINRANNGDIIEIPDGTYYENVIVNKSVTLKGNDVTILGNAGIGLRIEADNVIVDGLTVESRIGIFLENCNNLLVSNCSITDCYYSGFYAYNSFNLKVDNTTFDNNCNNLWLHINTQGLIKRCHFDNHDYDDIGIFFHGCGNIQIIESDFTDTIRNDIIVSNVVGVLTFDFNYYCNNYPYENPYNIISNYWDYNPREVIWN